MSEDSVFEVGRKTIYWMLAGFMITLVVIAFVILLAGYQNKLMAVPPLLKAELLSSRFVNNPACFTYQDESTGRVFSSVLDLGKFNSEALLKCYQTEPEKGYHELNFRLFLVGENKTLTTNNYFYEDDFKLVKKVLVRKEGKFAPDSLEIYVQEKI